MANVKRGRKKATPQQKQSYQDWQNQRVKIANLVSRNKNISKACCICGKPGNILHNRQDPYYIAFICNECRKDPNNLIIAEESRTDIRTKLNISKKSSNNFTDTEVTRIVIGYMNELVSIQDYCKQIQISRYQFNSLVKKYDKLFPKQQIQQLVINHSNAVQKYKIQQKAENEKLN